MSSQITFDEDSNIFSKSYDNSTFSFTNTYDNNGNIISDERNQYTYDSYGQLLSVSGEINSSYTYDNRGNILTKSNGTDEVTYSYGNADWQDQLTSVNGTVLTYDENGNLATYGDTQYTWTHGKWLESITDGDNSYAYVYDSNGIRASKTVNGVTTNFDVLNSTLYAQTDGTNKIYFQYKGSTPLGFILNDVQYFYITNLSGDVVGITDADGNLIAEYTYDEWGKLLAIDTAEEDNTEQLTIAETNPLRYRGYYYDNETGLYYLQSRYYNPELGRLISADGFEYIDTSNRLSSNAYAYCWNCPVAFSDIEGTTPELAFDMDSLIAFFRNAGKYIKEKLQENFTNLQSKFNAFAEKAKFWITHPDVIINNMLSKLLGREVHLRFRLVEWIRDAFERAKQEHEEQQQESPQDEKYGIATYGYVENPKLDNEDPEYYPFMITQIIFSIIEIDAIISAFKEMSQTAYDIFCALCDWNADVVAKTFLLFISSFNNFVVNHVNLDTAKETVTDVLLMIFDEITDMAVGSIKDLTSFIINSEEFMSNPMLSPFQLSILSLIEGASIIVPLMLPNLTIVGQIGLGVFIKFIEFCVEGAMIFANGYIFPIKREDEPL